MLSDFPAAVPEMPVSDINKAAEYYVQKLGFGVDWGGESGGITGLSKGSCRLFLTDPSFRQGYGNFGHVLIWVNLGSKAEVFELFEVWKAAGVRVVAEPEEKPWQLLEFTVADLDGNLLRVFYDFSRE